MFYHVAKVYKVTGLTYFFRQKYVFLRQRKIFIEYLILLIYKTY